MSLSQDCVDFLAGFLAAVRYKKINFSVMCGGCYGRVILGVDWVLDRDIGSTTKRLQYGSRDHRGTAFGTTSVSDVPLLW